MGKTLLSKMLLVLLLTSSLFSCKKKEEDEKEFMSGDVTFDFPQFVVVGQKVSSYMSGIRNPKNPKYFWVSKDLKIAPKDTVFGQAIDVTIPLKTGTYSLSGHARAAGFYSKSKSVEITAISTDEGSVSGLAPGEEVFIDPRDGHSYQVRTIGKLKWFTQNLQYAGKDPEHPVGCTYQNSEIGPIFGRLYTWNDATGGTAGSGLGGGPQGVCPEGWSVPTAEDWENLAETVSGGAKHDFFGDWDGLGEILSVKILLNDKSMWPYSPLNEHTNQYGWNAFPTGNSNEGYGKFENMTLYGMWWSSVDVFDGTKGCYRYIYFNTASCMTHHVDKDGYGVSVRCVRKADL